MGKKKVIEIGEEQTEDGKSKKVLDVEVKGDETEATEEAKESTSRKSSKKNKRFDTGTLYVESTYNNTKVTLTDDKGNTLAWSSSGALGFKGAKKGTPFAAAKIGETLAAKAQTLGIKDVRVVVKGVGSGRESAIRGFISKGIGLLAIQDMTPVPHNGPKAPKPRRM